MDTAGRVTNRCAGCVCTGRAWTVSDDSGADVGGDEFRGAATVTYEVCLPPGAYVFAATDGDIARAWDGATIHADVEGGAAYVLDEDGWDADGTAGFIRFDVPTKVNATSFVGNAAEEGGGALFLEDWDAPENLPASLAFEGNGAAYGDDVATTPMTMRRVFRNGSTDCADVWNSGQRNAECPIGFGLYDALDQLATASPTASVTASTSDAMISDGLQSFSQGIASMAGLTIMGQPDSALNVSFTASVYGVDDTSSMTIVIPLELRPCYDGEEDVFDACKPCAAGSYTVSAGGACLTTACDGKGFDCADSNASLTTLPLKQGYMRTRPTSDDALECAGFKSNPACPGGSGGPAYGCALAGHAHAPHCDVCDDSYYWDDDAGKCERCGKTFTAGSPATIAAIVGVLLGFLVVIYALFVMAISGNTDVKKAGKIGRLRNKLQAKWKIVFVGFNIMASTPSFLPELRYPKAYASFINSLDFVALDIASALPISCGVEWTFREELLSTVLGPIVLVVVVVLAAYVHGGARPRARDGEGAREKGSRRRSVAAALEAGKQFRRNLVAVTILVTYLVLPSVTTTIFRTFDCDTVDDPDGDGTKRYLRVRHDTRCEGKAYRVTAIFAMLSCVIWPVGVPFLYICEIYRHRDDLDPKLPDGTRPRRHDPEDAEARVAAAVKLREETLDVAHLQLLFGPYEPQFYFWEIFEMLRRVAATSMLVAFRDEGIKLFYSIFVALFVVKAYSHWAPFIADSDDLLAEVINWVAVFVFLGTLAAYVTVFEQGLGAFLVSINVLCLVVVVALVYEDINRERAALKFAVNEGLEIVHQFSSDSLLVRTPSLLAKGSPTALGGEVPGGPRQRDVVDVERRDDDAAPEEEEEEEPSLFLSLAEEGTRT